MEQDSELAELLKQVAAAEGTERAEALLGAGHRMMALGRAEEALAAVSAARDLFALGPSSAPLPLCDHNTAVLLGLVGRDEEALEVHRRAIELYTERFDLPEAARCSVHVAETLRSLGRHDDALVQYEAAAEALEGQGSDEAGTCRLERSELLVELGRFEEAHTALVAVRPGLTGCVSCVARCAALDADALAGLDRFAEALAAAEEATALWDACGVDGQVTACQLRVASLLARTGRADAALDRLEDLRENYRADGDAVGVARCDRETAIALEALGRGQDAAPLRRASAVVLAAAGVAA